MLHVARNTCNVQLGCLLPDGPIRRFRDRIALPNRLPFGTPPKKGREIPALVIPNSSHQLAKKTKTARNHLRAEDRIGLSIFLYPHEREQPGVSVAHQLLSEQIYAMVKVETKRPGTVLESGGAGLVVVPVRSLTQEIQTVELVVCFDGGHVASTELLG